MDMIPFNVKMAVDDMEGNRVLVFRRPRNPGRYDRVFAWQELTASAGATEMFWFNDVLAVDVAGVDPGTGNRISSARVSLQPGELYNAVGSPGGGLSLARGSSREACLRLATEQAGVRNCTTPYTSLDCNWYVGDGPVVIVPAVDWGMTCSFELQPSLYFLVAASPLQQAFSVVEAYGDMTRFDLPREISGVNVRLTKDQGRWCFHFSPYP